MAQKRMFTMKIVDSDAFLDMPHTAQNLYFHLNMRADDDGFIGNPKKILRIVRCSEDDLKVLLAKRFVLAFENGVIVIKHWRMHNCITQNRYNETPYLEEKSRLLLKENKSYSFTSGVPLNDKSIQMDGAAALPEIYDEGDVQAGRGRNEYPEDFETFWKMYPKKADKGQAYKKYQARIRSGYSPGELLEAARNYRAECLRKHTQSDYIKHAKTFLGDATPFVDYLPGGEGDRNIASGGGGGADFNNYL